MTTIFEGLLYSEWVTVTHSELEWLLNKKVDVTAWLDTMARRVEEHYKELGYPVEIHRVEIGDWEKYFDEASVCLNYYTRGVPLVLEWHLAEKTNAKTVFKALKGCLPPVLHEWGGRTHRKKLYLVPHGFEVIGVRISNSGRKRRRKFKIMEPTYINFLLAKFPLGEEEINNLGLTKV